ncbi:MAG TPA: RodZ domain-containing protein [Lacunisphaera sp.]|jgi:cytoskeletal protein RodZ|nr:RodZ domain-containing protein [Lacunisphaera sp.]
MQTIGEKLEEARKRKGISIREAAETTKIRSDYLQKFEANSFDIDLPPLYIRGFLRTYTRYLDLDPDRFVNDYNALLTNEGKPVRRESHGRVDFGESARSTEAVETTPAGRSAQERALMLKFGLLAGGGIVVVVLIILLANVLFFHTPAKSAASAQPAAATVQPEASQTLTLTAIDTTRVKVVQDLDGAVLFNGSLARGESKTVKKQGKLLITVESGKNLRMEVNGRSYPIPLEGYGRFALD